MAEKTSSHQPLFFKVLLPGFFTKLEIPPAFLSHIRVEKLDTATILSPQGIPWHVKVQGDISGLYFGEGWSEFVEAHDLQYGYFLVFCYEGGLIFSLRVFDLSCCKKEYTRYVENDVRNKKIKREYPEQEDDVKGFDGIPTPHSNGQIFVEIMKSVATSEQTKTIDNSQDQRRFETTRPHFKITIKRSHLFPKPHMAFHGLSDMPEVILVDPEQRTWPVKVYHIIGKTKQKRNDFRFGPGWQAFCANNNLKQGNVCIFEPQSEEDRLIHVHIDRREVQKTNVQTDGREVQKWPASPPKPQFFRVLLPESGFTTKLSLPRTLTEYFLQKNQKQATILSPLGKSWSIKVHGNINTLFFGDGWQDFAQAHDLDVGNILVFSYEGDMVFNVAIFDPSACEKEYIPMVRNDVTHNRITTEEQNSFRASKMKRATHSSRTSELCTHSRHCKASEPCTCIWKQPFEVIMRRGYVGSRSFMNIPRRASRYLWGIAKIVLRDPKERLWPVKLIQKCEKDRKRTSFGKGWLQFRINNHLEEGDVCIFELVSEEEKVMMHVNIQKDEQNLKNNSSRQCTVEGRKHLTSSSAQPAVKKTAVKKLKPVHSEDQKVSATMGITTPAALFKATIKSGNLHPKYPYMNIPSSFRVLNDLSGVRQIILRDPNRRRWPVRVKHRVKKNAACASFASGWQSFCAGNNLKEGDVCIFELIENSNVMIVDIIKEEQVREELESDT